MPTLNVTKELDIDVSVDQLADLIWQLDDDQQAELINKITSISDYHNTEKQALAIADHLSERSVDMIRSMSLCTILNEEQ